MRNSPWIHQSRLDSAPPVSLHRDPPAISKQEQDDMVDRISRPTESALYRQSLYWKLDSFMERGHASWTKMNLFDDYQRCMWTPEGAIKKTYKIRPHQKVRLPNLAPQQDWKTGRSLDLGPQSENLSVSGNSSRVGDSTSRHQSGFHSAFLGHQNGRLPYAHHGDVSGCFGSYRHPLTALPVITDVRKSASV